jgi:hypothetical protein
MDAPGPPASDPSPSDPVLGRPVSEVSVVDPGIAATAESAARVLFGLASVLATATVELLAPPRPADPAAASPRLFPATELALAVGWQASTVVGRAARGTLRVAAPVAGVLADPPLVPQQLRPAHYLRGAMTKWRRDRPRLEREAGLVWDRGVPVLVSTATQPIDLTRIVVDQVQLAEVVRAALASLDLTEVVVSQVDLGRVVDAALAELDLTEVVVTQVDVLGLAEYVVNGIDLPAIIRGSTGSVASEGVRTLRLQSVDADETVARLVDRVLAWRRGRQTDAPGEPESLPPPEVAP